MKILMIGNKESGKTTYMASAFGLLNGGIANFHIDTDSSTRNWYQRLFESIKGGGYPQASDKRDGHRFKLKCLGKEILDFEWIDYNGGIIKTIDADEFMKDISSCDGTMLFFDAKALYENDPSVHQVRRILTLISRKLGDISAPIFSVILVVTKIDLLNSIQEFNQAVMRLNAFIENAKGNDKIYARIVPISCSQNGFYNVELPILDMLDSGLQTEYYSVASKVNEEADSAQACQNKSGIIDFISSKLNGVPTYGEMARSHWSKAQEQYEVFKSIEGPMEQLKGYVQSYEITWPDFNCSRKNTIRNAIKRRLIKF